jgi:hypothetical protein
MWSAIVDAAWDFADDAKEWCESRSGWWLRAAFLLYLVYAGLRALFDDDYRSFFSGITFALHEAGHLLFSWLGQWLSIAGGSILQIASPVLAGLHLIWKQHDYYGLCVCGVWLGFSLQDASVYIADARAQMLPLVGFGNDPIHDWNYLLRGVGLLGWDTKLAAMSYWSGVLCWAVACSAAAWLCWHIRIYDRARDARLMG